MRDHGWSSDLFVNTRRELSKHELVHDVRRCRVTDIVHYTKLAFAYGTTAGADVVRRWS